MGDVNKPRSCFPGRVFVEINVMVKLHSAESWGAQGETFTGQVIFQLLILIYDQEKRRKAVVGGSKSTEMQGPFFVLSSEREADGRLKGEELQGGSGWGLGREWGVLSCSSRLRFPGPLLFLSPSPLGLTPPLPPIPHTHFAPLCPGQINCQ